MARRITTDTFLTITGPGISIKVARALQDSDGNVAVWWKPNGAPQRLFTVAAKPGLQMRGTMTTTDADGEPVVVNYRRRGVSCTWAICKGKFSTKQVAAWWPTDNTTDPAPDAAPKAAVTAAVRPAVRRGARATTASERRAARARARAARTQRAIIAERRAAAAEEADGAAPDPADVVNAPAVVDQADAHAAAVVDTADRLDRALGGPGLTEETPDERMEHLEVPEPSTPPVGYQDDPAEPEPEVKSPPTNAQIREWARDNGHEVSSRGKIPDAILEAYNDAHQER